MVETLTQPKKSKTIQRIIGKIKEEQKDPIVVFFGGIHGNEPAGVIALQEVFSKLNKEQHKIKGTVYGIRGNMPALLKKQRYLDSDLNRLWTLQKIEEIQKKEKAKRVSEEKELMEIHTFLLNILQDESSTFYFIDFHTTSSKTRPFITINDALINRKFSKLFPVPIILGIEEYLEGPLLNYINQLGYVSLGFESGQHAEQEAIKNSVAFIWLTMVYTGLLEKKDVTEFKIHYQQLQTSSEHDTSFYEITHRHKIEAKDEFKMLVNLKNFTKLGKGTLLAVHNQNEIKTTTNTIIFMPLYQTQGEEGFFLIRNIPLLALWASTLFRKIRLDALLTIFPGVSWGNSKKESLMVNTKTAKFLTKPFFHLLGYRNKTLNENHILMNNRERTAKNHLYRNTQWF